MPKVARIIQVFAPKKRKPKGIDMKRKTEAGAKSPKQPDGKEELKEHLGRHREIDITVVGRKSGRKISAPVWFVHEGDKLYLLPVTGSDTQWYKNILQKPWMHIDAQGAGADVRPAPITDRKLVDSIVEKFRKKHGAGDVKKYYSKLDVGVEVDLS